VGKLKAVSDTFNSWTGRKARHNRALRDAADLLAEIQRFYANYRLQEESPNFKSLLEKIGYAKFDLTNLSYHIRPVIKTAKGIIGVKVSPAMEEILNQLEDFRRALMNPALRKTQLRKVIADLHESINSLQDKLSQMEYK